MSNPPTTTPDPYYYARDHAAGPGAWCVYGPDGFHMTKPNLDKSEAYAIGKILSGKLAEAIDMLQTLKACR